MKQKPNSFTTYDLTDDEVIGGSTLTTVQEAVLQNKKAEIAEQRLNLVFDPLNPQDFVQQEAFLKGQIEILGYLIDLSNSYKNPITIKE